MESKEIQVYKDKYNEYEQKKYEGLNTFYENMKDKSIQLKEKLVESDERYNDGYRNKEYGYENQSKQRFDFNKLFNGDYFQQKIHKKGKTFGFYFLASIFLYSFGSNIPYAIVHYI